MRIAFFSTRRYDRTAFEAANARFGHEMLYLEARLTPDTVSLVRGCAAVCAFVNDTLSAEVVAALAGLGVRVVALRCTGYNNVDLPAATRLGVAVVRVAAYSPYAVAEHAVALMLALNRRTHRAFNRVREGNFSIDGLTGFDMHGKTVGVVGTGKIGAVACRILTGFGCRVLAFDVAPNEEVARLGVTYVPMDRLLAEADIVTLHCPLSPTTRHLIDAAALAKMKPGVMLINTSRGALVDAPAALDALERGRLGYLGMDVY